MDPTIPADQHHPFVDLDNHHDAEEALEAIRVAIGQSSDFGTEHLHDVGVGVGEGVGVGVEHHVNNAVASGSGIAAPHHDSSSLDQPLLKANEGILEHGHDTATPTLLSATQVQNVSFEKSLRKILDLAYENEVLLGGIKSADDMETIQMVIDDLKTTQAMARSLWNHVQGKTSDRESRPCCRKAARSIGVFADEISAGSDGQHRPILTGPIRRQSRLRRA